MTKILFIQTSPRRESVSHKLADRLLDRLKAAHEGAEIVTRDLSTGLPYVHEGFITAMYTPPEERNPQQVTDVALSDALVAELKSHSDILVIACPMYNFGPPALLKSWVDLVARVGVTFHYKKDGSGPEGLAGDRKTYIIVATGGAKIGSRADFLVPWLTFVLNFLGITDIEVIAADGLNTPHRDEVIAAAEAKIDAIAA
jgi:FMN-dependent NADH-azoreductase